MVDGPNMYNYAGGDPVNRWDPMGTDWIKAVGGKVYYQGESRWGGDVGKRVEIGTTDGTYVTLNSQAGGGIVHQASLEQAASELNRGPASYSNIRGLVGDVRRDSRTISTTPKLDRGVGAAKVGLELPRAARDLAVTGLYWAINRERLTAGDLHKSLGDSNEVNGTSLIFSFVGSELDKGKSRRRIILGTWKNYGTDSLAGNLLVRTNPYTGLIAGAHDIGKGEATGDYERAGAGYFVLGTAAALTAFESFRSGSIRPTVETIADDPALLRLWNESLRSAANSSRENGYIRYLRALDRGDAITQPILEEAFGAVSSRFLPAARDAGYNISATHHFNFPKHQFPKQVVDPRILVPARTQTQHLQMHQENSSTSNVWAGPIVPENVLPVPDWSTQWTPPSGQ